MKTFLLSLLLMCAMSAVHAQDKKAQDAARRLQAANQRLASDKAALERDKAQLAQKFSEAEKAAAEAGGQLKRSRHKLKQLEEANKDLEQKLADLAQREAELRTKLADTEKGLAEARLEGEQLRKRVANQQQTIGFWQDRTGACGAKNEMLSQIGNELVERYRNKTCGDVGVDNEPFLGVGRARMENLLEDYKERIRAQRVEVQK